MIRRPFFLNWLYLPQIEIDLDIQRDIHRDTVSLAGIEPPLFQSLDRVFIESKTKVADDVQDLDRPVPMDDGFQHHCTLETRPACFLRILRFDTVEDCWLTHATARTKDAAANSTTLTGTRARTVA